MKKKIKPPKANKKGQTIYTEEIFYPCEFRTRLARLQLWPRWAIDYLQPTDEASVIKAVTSWRMPVMITGWVQNEVHIQWGHQSLN
jgi:hypothetical protein